MNRVLVAPVSFSNFDSTHQQRIGNQGAMTTPGNGLRTHDCNFSLLCETHASEPEEQARINIDRLFADRRWVC